MKNALEAWFFSKNGQRQYLATAGRGFSAEAGGCDRFEQGGKGSEDGKRRHGQGLQPDRAGQAAVPRSFIMTTTLIAHKRLDKIDTKVETLERDVTSLKTETKIQFKEIFVRIKRIEALLIGSAGAIISMLTAILIKMS
jgi:hypothetical protein